MENLFGRLIRAIRLRSAIKHADRMKEMTRSRYYVIQIGYKLRVYNRERIKLLVRRGILHKRLLNYAELQKVSLYFTK